MSDPARIARILELLSRYWQANPDLRLGQIIGNCYGRPGDAYRMQDDRLEKYLLAKLNR